jgi:hypothetical protein
MADYYPLIARAVAGLEKNTGEARRGLYERARTALVDQLRGASPALGESDITRERLALEEAIRKVEAEAARRMRFDAPKSDAPPADAARRKDPARPNASPAAAAPAAAAGAPPRPKSPITDAILNESNPQRGQNRDAGRDRPGGERPSLSDEGLKGFRDVVAEAERLGGATALASRTARQKFAAVPSPSPEFDRMEPRAEPEGLRPSTRTGQPQLLEPEMGFEDTRPPRPRQRPAEDEMAQGRPPLQSYKGLITIAAASLAVVAILLTGYWQRHAIMGMVRSVTSLFNNNEPVQTARDTTRAAPKIPDRILPGVQQQGGTAPLAGGQIAAAPSVNPAVQVAQKVVLYEEDANDTAGKQFVGSAIWRTEPVAPAPGQSPELAVRADIEIPDRHMTLQWSLRRNTDQALPASHTVEIMFTLPPDFPHGGINNVPGILMKQTEQTRGVPLAGLAVKVTTGFFLLGLSAVETDMQRNIQLLKERTWFDIPIVYADGKRAILAVEKGNPGAQAFSDAFTSWAKK